jgi:hypothetical protein
VQDNFNVFWNVTPCHLLRCSDILGEQNVGGMKVTLNNKPSNLNKFQHLLLRP